MKILKYFLVFFYLILIILFLYKSGQILEISSLNDLSFKKLEFKLNEIKKDNYYLLTFYLFIFSFIWTLFLGFISPILLIVGFLLTPIQGAIIVSLANSVSGAILTVLIRNYFIRDIKKMFSEKVERMINLIEKNVNLYFFIFRLAGGFGAPSQIQNLIPSLTKIKIFNYIIISFFGCLPIYYVTTSIGYTLNFITEIKNLNISVFSNLNFLLTITIIITIIIVINQIKKRFNF
jgi:uncharacterized membrane protein YdjX (TVP38/TMEM64 family)